MPQAIGIPDGRCSKTSPEHSAPTKAKTSEPSSNPSSAYVQTDYQYLDLRNGSTQGAWLEMDGVLPGGCTTLNTGPAPHNGESASTLSQILEANAPEKYCLSAKACLGILRRAERRGGGASAHAQGSAGGGRGAECYAIQGNVIDRSDTARCNGAGWRTDQMFTFNTIDRPGVCYESVAVYDARGNGDGLISPTLTGDHENRVTDYTAICVGNGQLHQTNLGDRTGALNCMHDQQIVMIRNDPPVSRKYIVRRLTPLECCRLQGFPDFWDSDIEGSDTARYKMWGNGVSLPCVSDVLGRIAEEERGTENRISGHSSV